MRVQKPCTVSDKIDFLIHCIGYIHYTTLTVDVNTETQSTHIVQKWIVYNTRVCVLKKLVY